jgi:hypothetical protein
MDGEFLGNREAVRRIRFRTKKYAVSYFFDRKQSKAAHGKKAAGASARERGRGVRLKVRTNSEVKVLIGQKALVCP